MASNWRQNEKYIVLLKSDMGNLIATASGIWLCKNDETLNISWEEINAAYNELVAQQNMKLNKVKT